MTTDTKPVFESLEGMSEPCRLGLRNIIMACADTKLLLGYHYGEWTFGTPELEAAVASCSLSQSELGHVRLLQAVLKKHYGDDPERLIDNRPAAEFANVAFLDEQIERWPGFVAMNAIVDLAVARVLHAFRGSSFKPLRMSVEKMLDEERYHIHHGRGWFRALARQGEATRGSLERQACAALTSVAAWFGPADDEQDAALVGASVKSMANAEIFRALLEDVSEMASGTGVNVAAAQRASLDGWNPATRRVGVGGPNEEILFHLRGSKNEVFKLG